MNKILWTRSLCRGLAVRISDERDGESRKVYCGLVPHRDDVFDVRHAIESRYARLCLGAVLGAFGSSFNVGERRFKDLVAATSQLPIVFSMSHSGGVEMAASGVRRWFRSIGADVQALESISRELQPWWFARPERVETMRQVKDWRQGCALSVSIRESIWKAAATQSNGRADFLRAEIDVVAPGVWRGRWPNASSGSAVDVRGYWWIESGHVFSVATVAA